MRVSQKLQYTDFHSEGFVNIYEIDSMSADLKYLVFLSSSLENLPEGWKARVILEIVDDNNYRELFDLAKPGEPFRRYVTAHWTKSSR